MRPAAAADIDDIFIWYQNERYGLGEEFREALRTTLNHIADNPGIYQVIHRGARAARYWCDFHMVSISVSFRKQ